jgi:hypothetical protein
MQISADYQGVGLRILWRLPPRTPLGWLRRNRLRRRRLTDRPTFRHSSDELQLLEDRWKSLDFAQQQLLIRSFGEYRIRKGGRGAERLVILPASAAA